MKVKLHMTLVVVDESGIHVNPSITGDVETTPEHAGVVAYDLGLQVVREFNDAWKSRLGENAGHISKCERADSSAEAAHLKGARHA